MCERVSITDDAAKVVRDLKAQYQGEELIFHQSGGCCDGSSPMILPADDFYINDTDVFMGEVEGTKFYMNKDQFEYWKHTHLKIGVTEGRGSSFSLEIPMGLRFIIHSRILTDKENRELNGIV